MAHTQLAVLVKRVKVLKKHFCFKEPTHGITPFQEDSLRALLVLTHAEMEEYFEQTARALLDKAKKTWDKTKRANYNLAALLAYEKIDHYATFETERNHIIALYDGIINENHGIRIKNIKSLFVPLGYNIDKDFDQSLLSTLDSFGAQRGSVAHLGAKSVTNLLNQVAIVGQIDAIIRMLPEFEKSLYAPL